MKVLITGIGGALARAVALQLMEAGHKVAGLDPRGWGTKPEAIEIYAVDLRKRAGEDVLRRFKPDCVVHMATVSALTAAGEERSRINVGGTRAVFEHCDTHKVGQVVFVGRHTYYGAAPDCALYHHEEEPPLALGTFPELADLVAADLYAANALWRLPRITTSVLRLPYTLGPSRSGTLASFLRGRRVPMVAGYDPLFQFMDETDAAAAVTQAVQKKLHGVFNVAGPPPLPLSVIVRETGRLSVPVPEVIIRQFLGRFGFPNLPPGALGHLKFPVVVDAQAFFTATGFHPRYDEVETLHRFRSLVPPGGR